MEAKLEIKNPRIMVTRIRVRSTSPLILWPGSHRHWKTSLLLIEGKVLEDGCVYGIPCASFKIAMIEAARHTEINMLEVRQRMHLVGDESPEYPDLLVRIESEHPEDYASTVSHQGEKFTRMRPKFNEWSASLQVRYHADHFVEDDIIRLVTISGSHVGLGDFRHQLGGSHGAFEVY